jgi:RHS repeat-associated protein
VGGLEEATTSGPTTTIKTYYGGVAMAVNGALSYLVADGLGSITEALDTSGNVQASQLYVPYGGTRYSSGTMPTLLGFTGQRQDLLTGLYYYGARYYDPVAGQFISADTLLPGGGYNPWGLSRYAYVLGNPVSFTDPTGHAIEDPAEEGDGGGGPTGGDGGVGGDGGLGGGGGGMGGGSADDTIPPYVQTCGCVESEGSWSSVDLSNGPVQPESQPVSWEHDGEIITENPDGTEQIITEQGDVVETDANGNVVEEDGKPPSTSDGKRGTDPSKSPNREY